MSTTADTTSIYNDFAGFSRLRADASTNSPEAIREVARQFESVFIQMMLKSMRDASVSFESGLFSDDTTKTYTDMYDKQLSLEMTKLQGIGLADVIARQLSFQPTTTTATTVNPLASSRSVNSVNIIDNSGEDAVVVNALQADADFAVNEINNAVNWQSAEAFVEDSWPHAVRAGNALNIDPRVLIAQSALETGWGSRVHPTANGENSFCLFGIKAGANWNGRSVDFQTLEFNNGVMQREVASFRAYDSMAAAYDDYVNFLQSNPRYASALRTTDPTDYAQELQNAGYATDPEYASKIERIRQGEVINNSVSQLKISNDVPLT